MARAPLSFGNIGGTSTSRPQLTFGGDPIVVPWASGGLSYGESVPKARTGFGDLMSSIGLSFGEPVGGGGYSVGEAASGGGVTTGSIDGSAPFADALKGLAGNVLSSIGAGGGDRSQSSAQPVAYMGGGGGLQTSTLLLIGGAGLAVYWLATK